MSVRSPVRSRQVADHVVVDSDGTPILLVETKVAPGFINDESVAHVTRLCRAIEPAIPHAMIVDPDLLRVFAVPDSGSPSRSFETKTAEILRDYSSEFGRGRVYDYYFKLLIDLWLDDLVSHWKHAKPPGSEALSSIGLSGFYGGRIRRGVDLGRHGLR